MQISKAKAVPTKDFFVKMLTRDIELEDALLDLIDNCLDGAIRSGHKGNGEFPYLGYAATLTISEDFFCIEDNCGGIPKNIGERYAFSMGRPTADQDADAGTIGMYGIGMKRAIFKIGSDGKVETHNDVPFWVEFSSAWMQNEDWEDLPMFAPEVEIIKGTTRISIKDLREDVKARFSEQAWIEDFMKRVSQHYAIIISKGFEVFVKKTLGDAPSRVPAETFSLLSSKDASTNGLHPHYYSGEIDGVRFEIYAGLYRQLLSPEELETEEETRGSADNAGWTVACNDRVVIWKDKTRLTGWGEANVPNYHGQFIPVTGIVLFSCDDTSKLPLTTTKRGIDAASNVYLSVKDYMRDATKEMAGFTNKWKKFPEDRETVYKSSVALSLPELRKTMESAKLETNRKNPSVRTFLPALPEPKQQATSTRVSFTAEQEDIKLLSRLYYGTDAEKGATVGKKAFDEAVRRAKEV